MVSERYWLLREEEGPGNNTTIPPVLLVEVIKDQASIQGEGTHVCEYMVYYWRAIFWRLSLTIQENAGFGLDDLWSIIACSSTFLWSIKLTYINYNSPRRTLNYM